jgi:DNA polymerase-3 subunit alpha
MIPDASASNTTDYHNLRYKTNQLYFKSADEMISAFKEFPEAIASTLEITEKIEQLDLEPKKPYMPAFPIPHDAGVKTHDEYLDKLAREGVKQRYPVITQEIEDRMAHELKVIKGMGYAGYFLITHDFINNARSLALSSVPDGEALQGA